MALKGSACAEQVLAAVRIKGWEETATGEGTILMCLGLSPLNFSYSFREKKKHIVMVTES